MGRTLDSGQNPNCVRAFIFNLAARISEEEIDDANLSIHKVMQHIMCGNILW